MNDPKRKMNGSKNINLLSIEITIYLILLNKHIAHKKKDCFLDIQKSYFQEYRIFNNPFFKQANAYM